jgi:HEAT repeat protein
MGAEVVFSRSIGVREIVAVREVHQLVGWIEKPEARSHYDCVCIECLPTGTPDAFRRVRAAYERAITSARDATTPEQSAAALAGLEVPLERARGRISPRKLISFAKHPEPVVRCAAARLLSHFHRRDVEDSLISLLADDDGDVSVAAKEALLDVAGVERAAAIVAKAAPSIRKAFASTLAYARDEAAARVALERLATDSEPEVREAAIRNIEEIVSTGMDGSQGLSVVNGR